MVDIKETLTVAFWFVTGASASYAFLKTIKADVGKKRAERDKRVDIYLNNDKKMLDDHEERITDIEGNQKETDETNKLILRSLYALVNHSIDGNGIDGLKEVRKNITDFITK